MAVHAGVLMPEKQTCPHCGSLVEPKESDTAAGTLLICPECCKLIGRA